MSPHRDRPKEIIFKPEKKSSFLYIAAHQIYRFFFFCLLKHFSSPFLICFLSNNWENLTDIKIIANACLKRPKPVHSSTGDTHKQWMQSNKSNKRNKETERDITPKEQGQKKKYSKWISYLQNRKYSKLKKK